MIEGDSGAVMAYWWVVPLADSFALASSRERHKVLYERRMIEVVGGGCRWILFFFVVPLFENEMPATKK